MSFVCVCVIQIWDKAGVLSLEMAIAAIIYQNRIIVLLIPRNKLLKYLPSITSKIGAILKGKNFFPLRVAPISEVINNFLYKQPPWQKSKT